MKILIIEDSSAVSGPLSDLLNMHHFNTSTAISSLNALAKLKQDTEIVDLIILDMGLPVMSGEEFLSEKAKLQAPVCYIPVIVLTGDLTTNLENLNAPDVIEVIHKPADISTILAAIEKCMNNTKTKV